MEEEKLRTLPPVWLVLIVVTGCLGTGGLQDGAATCVQRSSVPTEPHAEIPTDHVLVRVTRDHGTVVMHHSTVAFEGGWTVMDALMAVADVRTAYGGGFVESIDGVESSYPSSDEDWFFEVDGLVSGIGAAQWMLDGGERIHWDYHAWTRTPYVAHFDTFPWDQARVLATASAQPLVPGPLTDRAEDWSGSWPAGPAVLVATPEEAPWDDAPRVEGEGACFEAGDVPWSLATRAHPGTEPRVLLVADGLEPSMPTRGVGWIVVGEDVLEVVDA